MALSGRAGSGRATGAARAVFAIWAAWLAICAATWATNARVPLRLLYAVDAAGIRAGAGRVVVLLCWPIALVAIALVAIAVDTLLAGEPAEPVQRLVLAAGVLATLLCATVAAPGVVDPKHLDAKLVDAPAAVGVALAFALSLWSAAASRSVSVRAPAHTATRRLLALLLAAALLFAALPWLFANVGVYVGDVPGLRTIFMSKQVVPEAGHPHLRAVHLGNHDGLDGLVVALSCVVLVGRVQTMRRLRTATGVYLSLLFAYGLALAAADWWTEQVVKRGWASERPPGMFRPSLSPAWAAILVGAALAWLLARRRAHRER